MDLLKLDKIPAAFPNDIKDIAPEDSKLSKETIEWGLAVSMITLLRCCGPLTFPTGDVVTIVDKPFHACAPGEISIEELEDADADAIITTVNSLTSLTKEAGAEAQPFPAKDQGADLA